MLLRYHRPGFDDAPRDERAALLADSCAYLNDVLEGMKKFMAYIEYGVPGRGAVPIAKSIARDVKAAVLKDVDGLTYHEIGKRLGVPPPADFSYKGDHPTVRKSVGRGRKAFEIGLGKEGRLTHIEAMKEESRRRLGMGEVERDAEDAAEALGISHEDALKLVEEEKVKARERGEEPGIA